MSKQMMVKASVLLSDLQSLSPGLARREFIEQTTSFIFLKDKVYTYNDEVSISKSISDIPFEGSVRADELLKLLGKLGDQDVSLSTKSQDGNEPSELIIATKRSRAGIRLDQEIRLPIDNVGSPDTRHKVPKDFFTAISFCLFSTSTDQTRPILTCVHSVGNVVEACDNIRAVRYTLETGLSKALSHLLIPASVAKSLVTYNAHRIGVTNEWIHFLCDNGVQFSFRRLAGAYPELSDLFNVKGKKFELPKDIADMIERAGIFSKTDIPIDEHVEIAVKDNRMLIHGKGDVGWYKEQARCTYKGSPFRFVIHPQFLSDVSPHTLKMVVGENKVQMKGSNFVYVVSLCV